MHTMWKGSISFGLVNVPVRMFAATESKDVKFRYLHKTCKTPIQYVRSCPTCDVKVDWNDIVRGVEYAPNQFVILEDEEMEQVKKKRSQTIDIVDFVELSNIDPVYYDKTYYLAPETAGLKAYRLLETAMNDTGKIAIARTVLRNTETLACIRTSNGVILMETLFWPDEVRTTEELPNAHAAAEVTEQERTMAVSLIQQLATEFVPERYVDEHREALLDMIQRKISEQDVAVATPAAQKGNIVDLMQALQESLRMTQTDKGTPTKPKAAKTKAKSATVTEAATPEKTPKKRKKATSAS